MQDTSTGAGTQAGPSALEIILKLQSQHKSGATWFYWIAALSLVNSIVVLAGATWNFVVGLGLMQAVDGMTRAVAEQTGDSAGLAVKAIGFLVNLGIAGVFVFFGFFANRRRIWAYVTGMMLYAFDGLLILLVKDYLGAGFHALVLFFIYTGLQASLKLTALEHAFRAEPPPLPGPKP